MVASRVELGEANQTSALLVYSLEKVIDDLFCYGKRKFLRHLSD